MGFERKEMESTFSLETISLVCLMLISLFVASVAVSEEAKPAANRPIVGCNRMDGCWKGGPCAKAISDKRWRHLWPFYTKVISRNKVEIRADTQEVMDKEIEYAHNAGLDYWAFDYYYYPDPCPAQYGYTYRCGGSAGALTLYIPDVWQYDNSRKLYLSSAHKNDINFCLIVFPGNALGPIERWPETVNRVLIANMKEPTYQKVMDNRPLLFVYMVYETESYFGSAEKAREGWNYLRQKAVEAGLGKPYIIAQVTNAQEGVEAIEKLGYDAMSAYAWADWAAPAKEYPYRVLAESCKRFWEDCRATGKPMVPLVAAGWDNRPLQGDDKRYLYPQAPFPWYTEATPQELADHLRSAIDWTQQNRKSVESNVVHIYAWNETGECGGLVPKLDEGAARLEAIREVLK